MESKRLIAIGDIHGCYHSMVDLLSKVNYTSATDTLVFLGDYIDRGPFSYKVVKTLQKLQQQVGRDKVICLRGNHEEFPMSYSQAVWYRNGGMFTSYDYDRNGAEVREDFGWFRSLPLYHQTENFIFCHAGLTYPDLASNDKDDLLWGRSWLEIDARPREKRVVFGHTPSVEIPYFPRTGDIGIDGGCVFGYRLCAMIIQENGEYDFVTVQKSSKDKEET